MSMRMQLSLSEEVRMRLLEEYFAGRLPSQPSQSSQPSQPSHTWKCHQHSAVVISKVLSLMGIVSFSPIYWALYQTFWAGARQAWERKRLAWDSHCWSWSSRGWSLSSKGGKRDQTKLCQNAATTRVTRVSQLLPVSVPRVRCQSNVKCRMTNNKSQILGQVCRSREISVDLT